MKLTLAIGPRSPAMRGFAPTHVGAAWSRRRGHDSVAQRDGMVGAPNGSMALP
jgi:hypothetical protein